MDPATGTSSSSGQMVSGSGAGLEYGSGTQYGSGSGTEYGSGTETQSGSGSQAMLADGSYLAGLAMGESARVLYPTALHFSALAATLVLFVFL